MIEREFVKQRIKEFEIEEFVGKSLTNVGHSHTKMVRTPLGEKIIVYAARPGLVVGREGQNIKKLTEQLKKKFDLENPQIEIAEVENVNLDARIVAERIVSSLERFGISKFKAVGHKVMMDVMGAGALGIEIKISGKVPSSRAKRWRFYSGYLKKSGDTTNTIDVAYAAAQLKSGTVGIQVRIMPPHANLPDKIKFQEEEKADKKEQEPESKSAEKETNEKESKEKDAQKKEEIKTKEKKKSKKAEE